MTFHSTDFLFFFLAVFSLCWILPPRMRAVWLLLASVWFYASWSRRFLPLLAVITLLSYSAALAINRARSRRLKRGLLGLTVVAHVGILVFFKLQELPSQSLQNLGSAGSSWLLPLGLSYYALQSLGYVIDVSRGLEPTRGLVEHALFISFFPQITAGPISRAAELLPQLRSPRKFEFSRFLEGVELVLFGFFQKAVVANNLSPYVDLSFKTAEHGSCLTLLMTAYAFAFQLYADFSGYTDIARGMAKCLGLELPINFNLPFFASDPQDAVKRWHCSLTRWFTDYVYRPLLDMPWSFYKLFTAPVITFIAMGLWHGLTPAMGLMGTCFGLVICAILLVKARALRRTGGIRLVPNPASLWWRRLLTFHLSCAGMLFLRSGTIPAFTRILSSVSSGALYDGRTRDLAWGLVIFAGPLLAADAYRQHEGDLAALWRLPWLSRAIVYALLSCLLLAFGRWQNDAFIYSSF